MRHEELLKRVEELSVDERFQLAEDVAGMLDRVFEVGHHDAAAVGRLFMARRVDVLLLAGYALMVMAKPAKGGAV